MCNEISSRSSQRYREPSSARRVDQLREIRHILKTCSIRGARLHSSGACASTRSLAVLRAVSLRADKTATKPSRRAPPAAWRAPLRVHTPPHGPSTLLLHNRGVGGPRGPSFYECCPTWKRRPRRPKWRRFCLDLRLRHPLSVLYTQAATPADADTWALGENSCLFPPCANFPDLAVESIWEK